MWTYNDEEVLITETNDSGCGGSSGNSGGCGRGGAVPTGC